MDVQRVEADSFFAGVSRRIDQSSTREAFVFVHGYNVTFEDAARRTAQMSYDLAFDGAPIFYSWPSAGSLDGYARDESNIEWTTPHLRDFLSDLALRSGAESIQVQLSLALRILFPLLTCSGDDRAWAALSGHDSPEFER